MFEKGSKIGDWVLEKTLSENKLYSTFKARRESTSSWSVVKVLNIESFNDEHFEKLKSEQEKLPASFRLNAEKVDEKYVFYRSFEETSVEEYLSSQRPRAGKAVHLLDEVLDSLIVLEKVKISPASVKIGNLLIGADGKVFLSDITFKDELNKLLGESVENVSTVNAFSELSHFLCCGVYNNGGSVKLDLRDEIPHGLDALINFLVKEKNDSVTLEWIHNKFGEIISGDFKEPITLTGTDSSFEEPPVKTERVKTIPPQNTQEKTAKVKKKKSNAFIYAAILLLIIGGGLAVYMNKQKNKSVEVAGMGSTGEVQETVEDKSPPPEPRKPIIREKLDLTNIKSKLPTGIPHDFLKGDTIPKNANHDWNLGPTGARGWIYSHKMETVQARQILIVDVAQGSPAAGVLQKNDVVLGVEEQLFSFDPRVELGRAIGEVEGHDGNLSMIISRDGEISRVELKLPVLGFYSHTAPFNCDKSQKIFEKGCEAIAAKLKANAKKGHLITQSYNLLALLASGKKEYFPLVRKELETIANSDLKRGYYSWHYGPVNMLVAEYIMTTGDKTLMPQLERITGEIIDGQSPVGTWGHRFAQNNELMGYGMMNCPGVPMGISLVLAREAGSKNPKLDDAIRKTSRVLRFYVGKGSIPYGDHHPWIQTHDDNGKNGAAAVMFNVLGDLDASKYFSRMSVASHGVERETGHTGNFWNMLWAMPGVAISGPNASGAWMEEYGWYYDLARRWDGSFIHQGPAEERHDRTRNWDSTGAYMLAYGQMLKKTHLTGRANKQAKISRSEAKSLIEDGRDWTPTLKHKAYAKRSDEEVINGLRSWSPVVRERSALSLADRSGDYISTLISMLKEADLYTQIGACQALAKFKGKSAPAVDVLLEKLKADDLWLRIKASEALAAIGEPAIKAVPQLLEMFSRKDESDPRQMQQRYLCFTLFNRGGMLSKSLDGVDKAKLLKAVQIGLANEDGRARGALSSVYKNLTYDQIKPLLPAIKKAIEERAQSGIMFCSEIRTSGLELFAKYKIREGLDMAAHYIRYQKAHGNIKRIPKVLKIIESYGTHAKKVIPTLESHAQFFEKERGGQEKAKLIRDSITRISNAQKSPELISL